MLPEALAPLGTLLRCTHPPHATRVASSAPGRIEEVPSPDDELMVQMADSGVHSHLGISVVEASKGRVVVELAVDERVHQPFGILHGGISALLAESAASIGAALNAPESKRVVGIEISASHLRSIRQGTLRAEATPIRAGRTIQVWHIDLRDEQGRQIADAKCTVAVVDGAEG
jgi:1,4-dihydroxy-2-naphthoyl-CoA hydrolase